MKDTKFARERAVEDFAVESTIKEIMVRSLIEARLQYTGKASGRLYEWSGAGQAVPVLENDVPELLSKRRGKRRCCGNGDEKIFEIVQEA